MAVSSDVERGQIKQLDKEIKNLNERVRERDRERGRERVRERERERGGERERERGREGERAKREVIDLDCGTVRIRCYWKAKRVCQVISIRGSHLDTGFFHVFNVWHCTYRNVLQDSKYA